ncbi:MAG TPA: hypothetical protein ENN73_01020 [Firmicutes bacterium]|nr:hypothetical protein [Bacillota bacterium]
MKFRLIQKRVPNHPAGYVYEAGALNFIMSDMRNYKWLDEFEGLINKSISLSKDMIKTNPDNPWGYFYLGAAYGFRGVNEADREKWFKAFLDGNLGYIQFKKVEQMDPSIKDIYYGLGTYHYWRGEKAKVFKWLPFFPNEKELGLEQLQIAIDEGRYTKVEGESSLLRILVNEEKYEEAIKLADYIIAKYPGYLYCYRYRATAFIKLQRYDDAIRGHLDLIDLIMASPYSTKFTLIEVQEELLGFYIQKGDYAEARRFGKILLNDYQNFKSGEVGKKVEKIRKSLKEIE